MDYRDRIRVYRHTQEMSEIFYTEKASTSKYYGHDLVSICPIPTLPAQKPQVVIINKDTLDAYVELLHEGFNPVLLNMANDINPGGGVEHGCGAQEENIFRRTNYYMTLLPCYYPLIGSETIYSKNVIFFKSNEETGYQWVKPKKISIIASASVKNPQINQFGFRNKEDYDTQYQKICMIFKVAIANHHDSLVLSAFGCGAFSCPPKQVAELFKKVISEYGAYFKKIIFAIKEVPEDPRNNFQIFYNVLSPI